MKKTLSLMFAIALIFALGMTVYADTGRSGETTVIPVNETVVPVLIEDQDVDENAAAELTPPPALQNSSNTPYFVGAGIAVLMFIGVAFYCKANGNKIL